MDFPIRTLISMAADSCHVPFYFLLVRESVNGPWFCQQARIIIEKNGVNFFSVVFDSTLFKLAGEEECMNRISD